MQEPKTDKDEEFSKKINDYINDPSTMKVSAAAAAGDAGAEGDDMDDMDLNALCTFLGTRVEKANRYDSERLRFEPSATTVASDAIRQWHVVKVGDYVGVVKV